jgi:hypothetical protein
MVVLWGKRKHIFTPHTFHFDNSPFSAYVNVNEQPKEIKVLNTFMDGDFIHTVITETNRYFT